VINHGSEQPSPKGEGFVISTQAGDDMPKTRKRIRRTTGLSSLIIAQLGMGTGIKWMTDEELKSSWREHDHRLTDHWQRNYDDELFVASIARMEG